MLLLQAAQHMEDDVGPLPWAAQWGPLEWTAHCEGSDVIFAGSCTHKLSDH